MPLSEFNRWLWQWLFIRGGHWTAEEVAKHTGEDSQKVFRSLQNMARHNLMTKKKSEGARKYRYGIEGTCFVPKRMTLAEVQD